MKTTLLARFILFNTKLFHILCIMLILHGAVLSQNALVRFGNSYVNLSKKTVGGTVEPGDTLEIRTTFYISGSYNPTGVSGGNGKVYKVRYFDNLPSNTDTIHDSLRLVTNEGMTFRRYTQAPGDDAGSIVKVRAFPADYQIRINMGGQPFTGNPTVPNGFDPMSVLSTAGASDMKAGTNASSNRPIFAGGMLVSTSFRVVVTGNYGDTIVLGAGKVLFRNSATSTTDTALTATQYKILISRPVTLCSSSVGTNFAAESGGTFDHGGTLNRSYAPTFSIPNYTYIPNSGVSPLPTINDGYYAIVNNISPVSSTFTGAYRQNSCPALPNTDPMSCYNREFNGFWFISGDHTGTGTAAGNNPPALGTDAGYMLLVNADLATSEAYRQTITGLCPNTYYQFSAWIKNVCPNCGIDTNSAQTYLPGVKPNVTFVVDGLDRISSGQLDTLGWQKRGFVLLTDTNQFSITISIRNNAPGGGGNDWALDDITLATCPPDLLLTPNKADTLCQGADDTVRFKIASYVSNYTQWKLEQSTNGGSTWTPTGTDTTGKAGSGTLVPVLNTATGQYENIISRYYRIAPSNSLIIYRIIVASTPNNLNSGTCSFVTNSPKIVHGVNCMIVLPTELIWFRGQVTEGLGNLQWMTANETTDIVYTVERSTDGANFSPIGSVNGHAGAGNGAGYQFTDPVPVNGQVLYRINITSGNYHRYSNQILLSSSAIGFGIKSVANPFNDHITIGLTAPANGLATIDLVDMYGRMVKQVKQNLNQGLNNLTIYGLGGLANGTYALRVRYADQLISKKMVKMPNLQ